MPFRAMDSGCGGTGAGTDDQDGCPEPVTVVGLHRTGHGTVWQSYACDRHAHHLIAPRPLLARDRDALLRRERTGQDPRVGRRLAGEREGPLAHGAAAVELVQRSQEWARRHPYRPTRPDLARSEPPRARSLTVDAFADLLALDPGDLRVILRGLDPDNDGLNVDGTVNPDLYGDVHDQVNHLCERTVPQFWWPGSDPDAGRDATHMR